MRPRVAPVFCLIVLLGCNLRAQEDEATRLFREGNQAYEQGDYEGAAQKYEQILQYGIRNGSLFYNLGNTYFRLNQLGLAIVYYEKALRLEPGDSEIRENLALATSLRTDKLEEPETPFWWAILSRAHHLLGLNAQLGLVAGLWVLVNAGLALRLLRRDEITRRLTAYVMAASLAVLAPGAVSAWVKIQQLAKTEGVVIVERVDLLSGPGEGNPVLVSVHEGLKVEIRNQASGWVQVVLPNGWNGWVPRSSLATI